MKIYDKHHTEKLIFSPSASSTLTQEVMGEDVVSLSFILPVCVPIDVDDYLLVEGTRYKARAEYLPRKISTQEYHYAVKFYAPIHDAERVLFLHLTDGAFDAEFSLDGTPREHLRKWVENMNRLAGQELWSIGTVIDAPRKTIDYHAMYCWTAGHTMAETFNTELWADGTVINLCTCQRGERITLGYRQGLTSLEAEEGSEATFFTRLIPLGSTRNIDPTRYGNTRLQLPAGQKYVERNTHYGLIEQVEQTAFADIYPKYVGTVSAVRTESRKGEEGKPYTVYYFQDAAMAFDPNELPLQGMVKRIVFQGGELNGRDFEANYDSRKKEWELINIYPEDGSLAQLPGGNLLPKVGDQYIPYNFRMPDEYLRRTEQDLLAAVHDYLRQYSEDPNVYHATTDYIHFAEQRLPMQLGQQVRLLSAEHFGAQGSRDTRMTKIVRPLSPYAGATLTFNNQTARSWRSSVDTSLSTLRYVLDKQVEQTAIELLKTWDENAPTNYNMLSALRTIKEIKERALSRTDHDTAQGEITFASSAYFGNYAAGLAGMGGHISPKGEAELHSLRLRSFLEVPELRYNRITAIAGEQWHSRGAGIVESVDTAARTFRLKLQEGELPTIEAGDICKAVYHTGTGFATAYFRIEEVKADGTVRYALREGYDEHPRAMSHFVQYGSFTHPERRQSAYSTTGYTRYLTGVQDWDITEQNIAMQLGDLSNLSIGGKSFAGYSAYLNNVYFSGLIEEIKEVLKEEKQPLYSLPIPHTDTATYTATADYTTVVYDAAGNYYIALRPVPAGIPLSDATYWRAISSVGQLGIKDAFIKSLFADSAFFEQLKAYHGTFESIEVKNSQLNNVEINGVFRQAWKRFYNVYKDQFDELNATNLVVGMKTNGGWIEEEEEIYFDWETGQSVFRAKVKDSDILSWNNTEANGRLIRLCNPPTWEGFGLTIATYQAPAGQYFYENGRRFSALHVSKEIVELIGWGDAQTFYGWIILRRTDILPNKTYGRSLKALAVGRVTYMSGNAVGITCETFDGSKLSAQRIATGVYRVNTPSAWGAMSGNFIIQATGEGAMAGRAVNDYGHSGVKANVRERGSNHFIVVLSDDDSPNDGSFSFMITNIDDFKTAVPAASNDDEI